MLEFQIAYRRHLPHIQPPGAILFVTYRLAGSLPANIIAELIAESQAIALRLNEIANSQERIRLAHMTQKQQFARWDEALDTSTTGPHWLRRPEIAQIIVDSLHHFDEERYDLDCYSIMSNHTHVVFKPLPKTNGTYHSLSSIMHSHKRYTAWKANETLRRSGQFWQHESYDHVVRDERELNRIRQYVVNNPVKAGLVETWEDWPWSFCKASL